MPNQTQADRIATDTKPAQQANGADPSGLAHRHDGGFYEEIEIELVEDSAAPGAGVRG